MLWTLIEEYAAVQPVQIAEERLGKVRAAGLKTLNSAGWVDYTKGTPLLSCSRTNIPY
ncbi:MAG: hypothetical protein Ct9H300mP25_04260 [Acidobacteriota bacterium]|nr:MAG: hypothetical protein Ct9H300mP25_04260 [Acidobacteriota bacterium]